MRLWKVLRICLFAQTLAFGEVANDWDSPLKSSANNNACAESRAELASAITAMASLEAQLEEARRRVAEKQLVVEQCGLNGAPHTKYRFTLDGAVDVECQSPCWCRAVSLAAPLLLLAAPVRHAPRVSALLP